MHWNEPCGQCGEDHRGQTQTKEDQTSGGLTHGQGMEMMTSVSSNSDCSNSYSMFTSHLPAFSDGQQLTGREREGGRGEGGENIFGVN